MLAIGKLCVKRGVFDLRNPIPSWRRPSGWQRHHSHRPGGLRQSWQQGLPRCPEHRRSRAAGSHGRPVSRPPGSQPQRPAEIRRVAAADRCTARAGLLASMPTRKGDRYGCGPVALCHAAALPPHALRSRGRGRQAGLPGKALLRRCPRLSAVAGGQPGRQGQGALGRGCAGQQDGLDDGGVSAEHPVQ